MLVSNVILRNDVSIYSEGRYTMCETWSLIGLGRKGLVQLDISYGSDKCARLWLYEDKSANIFCLLLRIVLQIKR